MAVLKSPRQTRNKKAWALKYANKQPSSLHIIEERKNAQIAHKLHLFLRDASHWETRLSFPPQTLPLSEPLPRLAVRPEPIITYGRNTFDSTSTRPMLFRKHARFESTRERYFSLLTAAAFLGTRKRY